MNSITLRLNKRFYTLKAINETALAFSGLAEIETSQEEGYYAIILKKITDVELDQLKGEFVNHCLMISKSEINPHNYWRYSYEKK